MSVTTKGLRSNYLAVIELDGEPRIFEGETDCSAVELVLKFAGEVRGSYASMVEIKVVVR